MEYVFLIFCILVFALFGFFVLHKIDHFLASGDFKFYTDDDDMKYHSRSKDKKKKDS